MKKGTKVKIVIASMALIILAVLVTYVVVKDKPNNEQSKGDEASQTANVEEKELLASTYVNETTNTKTNPSTADKIAKMETLMAGWGCNEGTKTGDKVKVVDVKIGGKDEEDEDDGDKDLTMPIPVPIGYTESKADGENTVNGGFVIYEGTEEVTNENVENAKKTRNQWVWVPVYDLDDICEYKNGELAGKLYNFNNDGRIACTDAREPDIVSNYDKDNYLTQHESEMERLEIDMEMTTNFEKTMKSIEKYGGFYIGRYETGGLNGIAKVVQGDSNINNQTWYTMYKKCKTLKGGNNNVITSMIYGCQWDRTLQWLVDTGCKGYNEIGSDSTSWGNYYNSTFDYTDANDSKVNKRKSNSTLIPSGSAEYTKANNIYDLAGNVWDWTLEAYSSGSRRCRGGSYNNDGYSVPADYRYDYNPCSRSTDIGCRAALYVAL